MRGTFLALMNLAMMLCAFQAQAQLPAPLKGGERILWIGNSLTAPCGNASRALVRAANPSIDYSITFEVIGYSVLKEHYIGPAPSMIAQGNWDIVVIQGFKDADWNWLKCQRCGGDSAGNIGYIDSFVYYGSRLYDAAHAVGAKVVFMWPQSDSWEFRTAYRNATYAYAALQKATGAFIVPCAWAWDSVSRAYPPKTWGCSGSSDPTSNDFVDGFYADCIHATGNGNILSAAVFYTIFTGGQKSPVGLRPPNLEEAAGGAYDPAKLDIILDIGYKMGLKALGLSSIAGTPQPKNPAHGTPNLAIRQGPTGMEIDGMAAADVQIIRLNGAALYRSRGFTPTARIPTPRAPGVVLIKAANATNPMYRRMVIAP